jgi:ABC-2 type transport system permease protein
MTTATFTDPQKRPRRNFVRIIAAETKFEFLKLLRVPVYSISVLAFPLMFYLVFGSFYGQFEAQGIVTSKYMIATFGAGGVLSAAMFAFGVGVASERGQGWMRLKRVSPMPPIAYFASKIGMALLFGALVVIVITLAGVVAQGVRIDTFEWLKLLGILLLGVFPFAALGMSVGYLFGPNSAPMVLNLLYMPMAFASGLWMPITILPEVIQNIAPYLPAYHYAQLALSAIGADQLGNAGTHYLVLAVYTVAFLALAVWAYWRDEGKTYG